MNQLTCCCSAHEDEAVYQSGKKCNEEDWQNLVTEVRGLTLLHTVLMLKLIYKLREPQGVAQAYEEKKDDHSHRERSHSGIQGVDDLTFSDGLIGFTFYVNLCPGPKMWVSNISRAIAHVRFLDLTQSRLDVR